MFPASNNREITSHERGAWGAKREEREERNEWPRFVPSPRWKIGPEIPSGPREGHGVIGQVFQGHCLTLGMIPFERERTVTAFKDMLIISNQLSSVYIQGAQYPKYVQNW